MSLNSPDLTALGALLNADTRNFLELMEIAGLDPKSDLRHCDLALVDMGEADVSGWDFTGTDLSGADLSRVQNILEAVFDEETIFINTRLPEGILPSDLVG